MIYFTADLHLGHLNIIRYCNRPFTTIEEHDQTLIDNWNAVVRPGDQVYVLGDFIFAKKREEVQAAVKKLNGEKFLILGNHDRPELCRDSFGWLKDYYEMTAHNLKWVLFHYPILEWHGKYRGNGTVHLHGHTHTEKKNDPSHPEAQRVESRRINVGVDLNGFTPVNAKALAIRIHAEAQDARPETGRG